MRDVLRHKKFKCNPSLHHPYWLVRAGIGSNDKLRWPEQRSLLSFRSFPKYLISLPVSSDSLLGQLFFFFWIAIPSLYFTPSNGCWICLLDQLTNLAPSQSQYAHYDPVRSGDRHEHLERQDYHIWKASFTKILSQH